MKLSSIVKQQIRIARVYGIPVQIDYRWFVVFALSSWLTAANFRQGLGRMVQVGEFASLGVGVITTLLLFLCIFGHELAHALTARLEGIETEEIVLHPFGGLARLRREPDSARAEFRIAIAGPVSSFLFAVLAFGGRSVAVLGEYWIAASIFHLVAFGNLLLAFFNLLPGYPLDGGRVLRALLWHRSGRLEEATRVAGLSGQLIAWTLVVFGVYIAWQWGDLFNSVWTVMIGLFLQSAAAGAAKGAGQRKFQTVADAMLAPVAIEPDVLISYFVDQILPMHRQRAVPVAIDHRLHGILTLEDLKKLPRERWHHVRARDVMRPVEPTLFTEAWTPLARAEELMRQNGAGALGVINNAGELIGFLQSSSGKRK